MKWLAPADSADRLGNSISRMPVQKSDDTKPIQQHLLHGFAGEQMDTIEHMHPYGFVNVPVKPTGDGDTAEGADGITLFLGSNRTHGINIQSGDRRFRLYKLADGEVALHDDQGHQVHIKRDGIHVSAPNSKKIVLQIMDDDTMPQDSEADSNGNKLNQIQQAGRPAAVNFTLDKDSLTINHPKAINFNAPIIKNTVSDHFSTVGETRLGSDTANNAVYGNAGGVGMTTTPSGGSSVLVNATQPGPPTSLDGQP